MPRALGALLTALVSLACLAPAAAAQEDGVFVDPGSPTGKEYAIPFDRARRQADPSGGGAGAPGTAPLFGAGIVATGGGGSGSDPSGSSGEPAPTGRDDGGGDGKSGSAASPDDAAILEAATQAPGAPSGGLGTPIIVALLAGGLLLAGGVAGVLIRRTRG